MRVRSLSFFVFFSLIIAACAESDGPTAPNASEILSRGALAPAAAVQVRHQEDLMAVPGVVGVGLGATESGHPAVVVLTERGGVKGLPASLGGTPVRVMVTSGRCKVRLAVRHLAVAAAEAVAVVVTTSTQLRGSRDQSRSACQRVTQRLPPVRSVHASRTAIRCTL